ncbi:hypothetical protein ASA1KI_39670 [Opitutales bacterium ASA1]|uniref:hypothetical protein n=1 Tax=Congregicoccus parvus TaxID=3081749 RepID=UPI002B30D1FC|nr:hypothetical protein ASA1KI_39670 [Opitutales bacterium ASA1]
MSKIPDRINAVAIALDGLALTAQSEARHDLATLATGVATAVRAFARGSHAGAPFVHEGETYIGYTAEALRAKQKADAAAAPARPGLIFGEGGRTIVRIEEKADGSVVAHWSDGSRTTEVGYTARALKVKFGGGKGVNAR